MQRIVLTLAVWSALLLTITGLAVLARPETGPPMPGVVHARNVVDALVPERDVRHDGARRSPSPDELSGTVAPRVEVDRPEPGEPQPAAVEPPAAKDAATRPAAAPNAPDPAAPRDAPADPRSDARSAAAARAAALSAASEGQISGLGPLPKGVPAEEEGFGLHVVRPDGRPAGDATVRWMLQRDLDALRAAGRDPDALDPADVLAGATSTVRANAGGFAMLTSEAGTMLVDARSGDLYGWLRIRREDVSHGRIRLQRDVRLAVRVVDARGAARAGVPIVLRSADCRAIWSARTDADGAAELRHAGLAVDASRARFDDLTIAVDAPDGATRAIPNGEFPAEPVTLTAEPGVRVLVWVRDAQRQPCRGPTRVRLAPAGREDDCGALREREAVDGLAVFEDVPVGLDLVVVADAACSPVELRDRVGPRPATESNVILAATIPMPRVRGALLDPSGGPWRGLDVVGWIARDGGWVEQGAATTDDRGRFELDVRALHGATSAQSLVLVARNRYGRTVASASLELAPASPDPTRDLGDVPARDWPVLVRGAVVDESDRPLEGAPVELCDAGGQPDPRTRVATDERGQFALRGPAPAADSGDDALLVRALEPEQRHVESTVALRRGDQRARIVVSAHGRVEGRVVLPDNAPRGGSVNVRLRQRSGSEMALTADENGAFAFSVVESGSARLSFAPQGFDDQPVLVLDDVVVPHGGPSADPRLSSIDLRPRIAVVELEVVDEQGRPVPNVWAGPVDETRPNGRPYELEDGVAHVVVARDPAPMRVWTEGYAPVVLAAPAGRVRVVLRPGGG